MKLELRPFDMTQALARAGLGADGRPLGGAGRVADHADAAVPATGRAGSASFRDALTQALGDVSRAQDAAQALQREVQLDNPAVSLEQTMLAMQKSQLGFQAALTVRNRLVQAYTDVMNMAV